MYKPSLAASSRARTKAPETVDNIHSFGRVLAREGRGGVYIVNTQTMRRVPAREGRGASCTLYNLLSSRHLRARRSATDLVDNVNEVSSLSPRARGATFSGSPPRLISVDCFSEIVVPAVATPYGETVIIA